jgi:serine/threonine-protein kinase RsbW
MAISSHDHGVELNFPNELGYERIAMVCSALLAKMHDCPVDRIEDLKTVVAEAAINAMQHGNKWHPKSRVTVKMEVEEDTIHISVMDEGSSMQEEIAEPDIKRIIEENIPARGFGLGLMRSLSDGLEFKRLSGGGHRVRIAIRMQSRAGICRSEVYSADGSQV